MWRLSRCVEQTMTPYEITAIRTSLRLTQSRFAAILGIHSMTLSKWERGVLTPDSRQEALLVACANARHINLTAIYERDGALKCLWAVLDQTYGRSQPPSGA